MSEPRMYVVGLPVTVVVHDDGTVDYEIDTAEAGQAITESEPIYNDNGQIVYDDETILADQARVDADHARRWAQHNQPEREC